MLRTERTKEFNNLIKEEHFYRIANIIKKNAHKRDILQLISNYDNFYEKLEWIDIILSMSALTDWEVLNWKKIYSHKDLTEEFIRKHRFKPWKQKNSLETKIMWSAETKIKWYAMCRKSNE